VIGVYALRVGDVVYVGASIDIEKRIKAHEWHLRTDQHSNEALQNAYLKSPQIQSEILSLDVPTESLAEEEQMWSTKLGSVNLDKIYNHKVATFPWP
jgi:hypothetical protein